MTTNSKYPNTAHYSHADALYVADRLDTLIQGDRCSKALLSLIVKLKTRIMEAVYSPNRNVKDTLAYLVALELLSDKDKK